MLLDLSEQAAKPLFTTHNSHNLSCLSTSLGQFMRSGPGWKKYPQIKEELNPAVEDNGMCWVTKKEFFNYFPTLYVCAFDMTRLKDPNYVNDLEDHFHNEPSAAATTTQGPAKASKKKGPIDINKSSDPSSPYKIVETSYNGGLSYFELNKKVVKGTSIAEGVEEFRKHPDKYLAILYQNNTLTEAWPVERHTYTLVYRTGTDGLEVQGVVSRNGKKAMLTHVKR